MPDLSLEWQGDFVVSATGGLALAYGDDFARQRIERRLFTAVKGYIWDLTYGAGLPQKIGSPASLSELRALVRSQIAHESSVAATPMAQVTVATDPAGDLGLYYIRIKYVSAATGEPVTLTFTP